MRATSAFLVGATGFLLSARTFSTTACGIAFVIVFGIAFVIACVIVFVIAFAIDKINNTIMIRIWICIRNQIICWVLWIITIIQVINNLVI